MRGGTGRWTRLGIAVQVLFALVLAVGAAALLVDLSDWKYLRVDVSATGRNTVDETLLDLVDQLPETAQVDLFFRPLEPPYDGVSIQGADQMRNLLYVVHLARRDQLEVTDHDPRRLEETQARRADLGGVEGMNVVVISCGGRRATLQLFGDIVTVDWGNPTAPGLRYLAGEGIGGLLDHTWNSQTFRHAQVTAFRGGDALAQALLKVTSGRPPRAYFAVGHGEADLRGSEPTDLGELRRALQHDGFEVEEWDASRDGPVPDDCEVLALIGARQPYLSVELGFVRDYVSAGGRVIAAPALEDVERELAERAVGDTDSTAGTADGISGFLAGYGMLPRPGIVCTRQAGRFTGASEEGDPSCARLVIGESGFNASHQITIPLRQRDRRVQYSLTHSFDRGGLVGRSTLEDLVSSPPDAWLDLPNARGELDFRYDHTREESQVRARLCMLARLREQGIEEAEGRVIGLASSSFLGNGLFDTNRDFLLNTFNWMVERDHRVRVRPLDPGISLFDVHRGGELTFLSYLLWLGLPGLSILVGGIVAWRRRR